MRWLKLRFLRESRQQRGRMREWLRRHPRLAGFLRRTGSLDVDEYTLARGVALGLFVGLTPTVGIQTFLMICGSILFRANFPAAFAVSWVSNPLTMAPLYFGFNRLGEAVLKRLPVRPEAPVDLGDEIAEETLALVTGSLLVAAPVAAAGYALFLWLWRRLDLKLPRRGAKGEGKE